MSKFTLILNSHALSNFQICAAKYQFTDVLCLRQKQKRKVLERGTLFAKLLALYYHRKRKGRKLDVLFGQCALKRFCKVTGDVSDALSLHLAWTQYRETYKDESWTPICTERGGSKIIHEDKENLFVYEFRPDLLVNDNGKTLVVDHKTEQARRSIYPFNNQTLGYLWGCSAYQFVYNYLTLTKEPQFRREPFVYTEAQIEAWRQSVVKTYFRLKTNILERDFSPSWQCEGKYGRCVYAPICEQPRADAKIFQIKTHFQIEKRRFSW